jgi:anti-sigma B factor antagonist
VSTTAVQTLQTTSTVTDKTATQTFSPRRRVITLSAEGELGEAQLVQIGEELFRLAHRGHYCVVLDLSEVHHLDYRGVRPLLSRAVLFRQAGGDIKLCGLSAYLKAIFRAAGARDEFEYFESAEQARMSFVRSAIG